MAEVAGIACTIGSMPELGIGTAAEMHLAVAMPELLGPSDVCGVLYNAEGLIQERLPISDGLAGAPEGMGLGVTLDETRLTALSEGSQKEEGEGSRGQRKWEATHA
jgi:muconate cycloisomerase